MLEQAAPHRRLARRVPGAGHLRPTPATTCSTSARCSTAARRRWPRVAEATAKIRADRDRRPAAARRPSPLQLRRGGRQRPRPRRRAEDLPAELRRVLRGAPVPGRRQRAVARACASPAHDVPFGADLIFEADQPAAAASSRAEICEDVWVPIPPSSYAALAGATVLVNLSASNITIGKADYRHRLVGLQSARCLAAYLYSSAGLGESTTDLGLGRPGADLRERRPARRIGALRHRLALHQSPTSTSSASRASACARTRSASRSRSTRTRLRAFRRVAFELPCRRSSRSRCSARSSASRTCRPTRRRATSAACEVYNIQVKALVQRLSAVGIEKLVIGISGGLDSTHALLVCAAAMDRARAAAERHPRLHDAGLRDDDAHARAGAGG